MLVNICIVVGHSETLVIYFFRSLEFVRLRSMKINSKNETIKLLLLLLHVISSD